jgi:glutathione S-transferase
MFHSSGEEQEKAVKDSLEMLKTIEEHALGKKRFFCGDKISLVDIAYGWIAQWLAVLEEVAGIKLMEPQKFPRLHTWIKNFKDEPIIKENLPGHDEMLVYFKPLGGRAPSR